MGQRSEVRASLRCFCMWRLDSNFVAVTGRVTLGRGVGSMLLACQTAPRVEYHLLSKKGGKAERQQGGRTDQPLAYRGRRQTKADRKRRDFLKLSASLSFPREEANPKAVSSPYSSFSPIYAFLPPPLSTSKPPPPSYLLLFLFSSNSQTSPFSSFSSFFRSTSSSSSFCSFSPLSSCKPHPNRVPHPVPPPRRHYKDGDPEACRPAGTR